MTNNRTTPDREVVEREARELLLMPDYSQKAHQDMIIRLLATSSAGLPAGHVVVPVEALDELLTYADLMPKRTPAAGSCATEHQFTISAGAIWGLDQKVANMRAAMLSTAPKPEPVAPQGVEELRAALEEIANAYNEWSPDASFASSDLFKVSARARAALADRGARQSGAAEEPAAEGNKE